MTRDLHKNPAEYLHPDWLYESGTQCNTVHASALTLYKYYIRFKPYKLYNLHIRYISIGLLTTAHRLELCPYWQRCATHLIALKNTMMLLASSNECCTQRNFCFHKISFTIHINHLPNRSCVQYLNVLNVNVLLICILLVHYIWYCMLLTMLRFKAGMAQLRLTHTHTHTLSIYRYFRWRFVFHLHRSTSQTTNSVYSISRASSATSEHYPSIHFRLLLRYP